MRHYFVLWDGKRERERGVDDVAVLEHSMGHKHPWIRWLVKGECPLKRIYRSVTRVKVNMLYWYHLCDAGSVHDSETLSYRQQLAYVRTPLNKFDLQIRTNQLSAVTTATQLCRPRFKLYNCSSAVKTKL